MALNTEVTNVYETSVCRFCLRNVGLMPLSFATTAAFSYEDVLHFAGIKISADENVSICDECCIGITNSVQFRKNCLSNDIVFKKLHTTCVKDSAAVIDFKINDNDSQHSSDVDQLENQVRNDTDVIVLDSEDDVPNEKPVAEFSNIGSAPRSYADAEKLPFNGNDETILIKFVAKGKQSENSSRSQPNNLNEWKQYDPLVGDHKFFVRVNQPTALETYAVASISASHSITKAVNSTFNSSSKLLSTASTKPMENTNGSALNDSYSNLKESVPFSVCNSLGKVKPPTFRELTTNDINAPSGCSPNDRVITKEPNYAGEEAHERDDVACVSDIDDFAATEYESDDSMISLYSEMMEKAAKDILMTKMNTADICEVIHPMSVPVGNSMQKKDNKETAGSVEKLLDSTDSDTSVQSLYDERQLKKKLPNISKAPELCPYCGAMTRSWVSHIKRAHIKNRTHACPHCPKKFYEKFFLKRHLNTVHEKRIIFTCEHCGKGFVDHSSHFYHMTNSHGKSDVYECDICHRKMRSFDGYKKHLKLHSLASYPCSKCDKLFKTPNTLEKHCLRYHAS